MIYTIEAEAERARTLAFMAKRVDWKVLFGCLGRRAFEDECLEIKIVCSPGLPPGQEYRFGWLGHRSDAEEWLFAEICRHLEARAGNLVVIEDPCGHPSDPGLTSGAVSPPWFYRERVLWPITVEYANVASLGKIFAWGDTWCARTNRVFPPLGCGASASTDHVVSDELLRDIGSSMTRLVTDVFDGEGYLVWERKIEGEKTGQAQELKRGRS